MSEHQFNVSNHALRKGAAGAASSILLTDGAWALMIFGNVDHLDAGVSEFVEELEYQASTEGIDLKVRVLDGTTNIPALIAKTHGLASKDVAILRDQSLFESADLHEFDVRRNIFLSGPRLVFMLTPTSAKALLNACPNASSWFGALIYDFDETEGVMNVEQRLSSLEGALEMSRDEIVSKAEAKLLPLGPKEVEALVLLRREDLL